MAKLEEYLGTLVSNLSQARVLADLESARIAEAYASNNLLRHFSIPRMKIQDVELSIPIAIDGTTMEQVKEVKPLSQAKVATAVYSKILDSLGVRSLQAEISTGVKDAVATAIKTLDAQLKWDNVNNALSDFAQYVSVQTEKNIEPMVKANKIKVLEGTDKNVVLKTLQENIIKLLKGEIQYVPGTERLRGLDVTVETDKLKAKNPESLVILKMKISEENMEWVTMEDSEGKIVHKLMPY